VFHTYVYGDVPPLAETAALPSLPPKQLTFVLEEIVADKAADGSVMVTVAVVLQFLLSVTVTVYVPAESPLAV
jgi:hypothetical protein